MGCSCVVLWTAQTIWLDYAFGLCPFSMARKLLRGLLATGKTIEVRGPSGSGKTTFLKALAVAAVDMGMSFLWLDVKGEAPPRRLAFPWEWVRDRLEEAVQFTAPTYRPGLALLAAEARDMGLAEFVRRLRARDEAARWLLARLRMLDGHICPGPVEWPPYTAAVLRGVRGLLLLGLVHVSLPRLRRLVFVDDLSPLAAEGNRHMVEAFLQLARAHGPAVVAVHDYPARPEEHMRPLVLAPAEGAAADLHRYAKPGRYVVLLGGSKWGEVKARDVHAEAQKFGGVPFTDATCLGNVDVDYHPHRNSDSRFDVCGQIRKKLDELERRIARLEQELDR